MKNIKIKPSLLVVLILSVVYFILSPGRSLALALPLVLVIYQFADEIRAKRFFPMLLIATYILACVVYIGAAFSSLQNPAKICACTSFAIQTMLFAKTFDYEEFDNEFDFEDYKGRRFFYLIGIFALPLAAQYAVGALAGAATVFAWICIALAVVMLISPIMLIKSLLSGSAFTSGAHVGSGDMFTVEKVAKQVAKSMWNVTFVSVRSSGNKYVITINTGSSVTSVKNSIAKDYYDKLLAAGMDASRIDLRY